MISTHILDTSKGLPAQDVPVILRILKDSTWVELERGVTNNDGRYKFENAKETGKYQITFEIENYLEDSFFLNTPIGFQVRDTNRNYHVPLLLNPYGMSTYRGS